MGVPDAGGVVDAEVDLQPSVPVEELQDGHLDSRGAPLGDTDQHLGVDELYPALDEVATVPLQQPPALGQPLLVRHTGALGECGVERYIQYRVPGGRGTYRYHSPPHRNR